MTQLAKGGGVIVGALLVMFIMPTFATASADPRSTKADRKVRSFRDLEYPKVSQCLGIRKIHFFFKGTILKG